MELTDGERMSTICLAVLTRHGKMTNAQTVGQTDRYFVTEKSALFKVITLCRQNKKPSCS